MGRNMTVIEYRGKILIIDMGVRFPEEDMPGVDYIIPNVGYLEKRTRDIVGVVFTHSHFDHIGAIPYLIESLGYPPMFATPLTRELILRRTREFPNLKEINIKNVQGGRPLGLSPFTVEFFNQNHNVPDSAGIAVSTPVGTIINTGDFKFDFSPVGDKPADLIHIAEFGRRGVLLLMSDSTGAEEKGFAISETEILKNLENIFISSKGRIIVATFSTLLTRIQEIILLSEKYNRKVAIEGYSMRSTVDIARRLGYIKMRNNTLVHTRSIKKLQPSQVTIIGTGAQGEGGAMLMRVVSGEHKYIKLRPGDTVVFSSSVIPGNERTVQSLKDDVYRQGATVYHYQMMDIHSGGHGKKEDLRLMLALTKPRFFMPVHGNYSMLVSHAELAKQMSIPGENIVIAENGQVIGIDRTGIWKEKEVVVSNYVMVDGLGVGDVGSVVLRDRQTMAQDGIIVIIAIIDTKNKQLKEEFDIISRGFVYIKESGQLLKETKQKTGDIIRRYLTKMPGSINYAYLRSIIREEMGEFLFAKTERRPMILPVVIEI